MIPMPRLGFKKGGNNFECGGTSRVHMAFEEDPASLVESGRAARRVCSGRSSEEPRTRGWSSWRVRQSPAYPVSATSLKLSVKSELDVPGFTGPRCVRANVVQTRTTSFGGIDSSIHRRSFRRQTGPIRRAPKVEVQDQGATPCA